MVKEECGRRPSLTLHAFVFQMTRYIFSFGFTNRNKERDILAMTQNLGSFRNFR